MLKVLYVYEERIPEKLRELVTGSLPKDEFVLDRITYTASPEEWKQKLAAAEVVLFAPGRFLPEEVLEHARHIKLMQLWSSGYDKFNLAGAKKFGIPVANNGGANAGSVAEHAVLLMLAVSKWLPDSHRRTVEGAWAGNSHGLDMRLLFGKRIGILGFGNIGRYVARKLSGFEATIQYFDINRATEEVEREYRATYVPFDELIATSDILTLHLHNTPETKNRIGREEFARMKDGAILINVSRAELVDQEALLETLQNGKLHGAGLDVYLKEPTSPNDPLLTHPHVVATPHMAGSTYDTYLLVMERVVENFRKVARGESPQWLI